MDYYFIPERAGFAVGTVFNAQGDAVEKTTAPKFRALQRGEVNLRVFSPGEKGAQEFIDFMEEKGTPIQRDTPPPDAKAEPETNSQSQKAEAKRAAEAEARKTAAGGGEGSGVPPAAKAGAGGGGAGVPPPADATTTPKNDPLPDVKSGAPAGGTKPRGRGGKLGWLLGAAAAATGAYQYIKPEQKAEVKQGYKPQLGADQNILDALGGSGGGGNLEEILGQLKDLAPEYKDRTPEERTFTGQEALFSIAQALQGGTDGEGMGEVLLRVGAAMMSHKHALSLLNKENKKLESERKDEFDDRQREWLSNHLQFKYEAQAGQRRDSSAAKQNAITSAQALGLGNQVQQQEATGMGNFAGARDAAITQGLSELPPMILTQIVTEARDISLTAPGEPLHTEAMRSILGSRAEEYSQYSPALQQLTQAFPNTAPPAPAPTKPMNSFVEALGGTSPKPFAHIVPEFGGGGTYNPLNSL